MDPHATVIMILKDLNPSFPLSLRVLADYIKEKITDRPIEFHPYPLPTEATALCYCRPSFQKIRILLNSNRPMESQRFGGFHELGHLALEHKIGILRIWGEDITGEEDPLERAQADQFAVEMMMPETHVFQVATRFAHPLRLINEMKKTFGASMEAVIRRIVELRIYHGGFFLYDPWKLYFAYYTHDFDYTSQKLKDIMIYEYRRLRPGDFVERELPDGTMEYCVKWRNGQVLLALVQGRGSLYESLAKSWSHWFGINFWEKRGKPDFA
ncbi:ImmA/IrrE family metallo-endopeptidase [Desulfofundulus salinus]|nr:ImmA/IrrE family metallo-endopeptidase [Desulfofundulus salinum]